MRRKKNTTLCLFVLVGVLLLVSGKAWGGDLFEALSPPAAIQAPAADDAVLATFGGVKITVAGF